MQIQSFSEALKHVELRDKDGKLIEVIARSNERNQQLVKVEGRDAEQTRRSGRASGAKIPEG